MRESKDLPRTTQHDSQSSLTDIKSRDAINHFPSLWNPFIAWHCFLFPLLLASERENTVRKTKKTSLHLAPGELNAKDKPSVT